MDADGTGVARRPGVLDSDESWYLPAQIYVPARPDPASDEPVLEVRELTDGRRAMSVYSSMEQLITCCGSDQPWLAFSSDWLPVLQRGEQFDVVVVDVNVPVELRGCATGGADDEQAWHDPESADWTQVFVPAQRFRKGDPEAKLELQPMPGDLLALMIQYADTLHVYETTAATYAAKVRAFEEAGATVVDARLREAEAHRALDIAMDRGGIDLNGMKAIGTTIVGIGLGVIAGLQTAVSDLLRKADKLRNHGMRMQEMADEPKGSAAKRAAAIWAANAAAAGEGRTRAEAHRLQGPIRAIPEGARLTIAHNPGEYIRDGKGWVGLGRSAARGVPFVGTGVIVASGAADVAMGKPVGQAAAATGATLGGGAVGGMAGAAIGSFFFPGVGTVVGGVVGGVIGSVTAADGVGRVMGDQ